MYVDIDNYIETMNSIVKIYDLIEPGEHFVTYSIYSDPSVDAK